MITLRRIIFCLCFIVVMFYLEASLEFISDYVIYKYGGPEYGFFEAPQYFKTTLDFFGAKMMFWLLIYSIAYYVFFSSYRWKLEDVNLLKVSGFNFLIFWISCLLLMPLFSATIIALLGFDKEMTWMSKAIHSSIIALISPLIVYALGVFRLGQFLKIT